MALRRTTDVFLTCVARSRCASQISSGSLDELIVLVLVLAVPGKPVEPGLLKSGLACFADRLTSSEGLLHGKPAAGATRSLMGDTVTCPTSWVPVPVANWRPSRKADRHAFLLCQAAAASKGSAALVGSFFRVW